MFGHTTGVNFINIICTRFSYKFFEKAKTYLEKWNSYEKFVRKTLMKLTPGWSYTNGFLSTFKWDLCVVQVRNEVFKSCPCKIHNKMLTFFSSQRQWFYHKTEKKGLDFFAEKSSHKYLHVSASASLRTWAFAVKTRSSRSYANKRQFHCYDHQQQQQQQRHLQQQHRLN